MDWEEAYRFLEQKLRGQKNGYTSIRTGVSIGAGANAALFIGVINSPESYDGTGFNSGAIVSIGFIGITIGIIPSIETGNLNGFYIRWASGAEASIWLDWSSTTWDSTRNW